MADLEQLRNTVERASSKRLGDHVEHLRREIAEDVLVHGAACDIAAQIRA